MSDDRSWFVLQLKWIAVSLVISLTLSLLLPFYISLPLTVGIFIGMSYFMRRRIMKQAGGGDFTLSYYCMACGHKHNKIECPKCGSKMKRAGG